MLIVRITADQDTMILLHMLLQIEVVLIRVVTEMALVGSDVLVRVHVTLITREVRESLLTICALIQLLIILYMSALDVLLHFVISFK